MSVADQIEKIAASKPQILFAPGSEESRQLKDLEEVEATLKEIGITLEPCFNISLAARIGGRASKG